MYTVSSSNVLQPKSKLKPQLRSLPRHRQLPALPLELIKRLVHITLVDRARPHSFRVFEITWVHREVVLIRQNGYALPVETLQCGLKG
jgi:hypothetical protein